MKISGSNPVRPSSSTQRKKDASSASSAQSDDFLSILGGATAVHTPATDQPISDVQAISTVGALLTLQEMPEEEIKNRKAILQSKTTLDMLEQLRHSLLMGNTNINMLHNLSRIVNEQKHHSSDPKLKEIIDDIELRAAVELAKLERASQS